MRVCVREHVNDDFGQVPAGSLWEDDHYVVAADPRAFRVVRVDRTVDDEDEEGD